MLPPPGLEPSVTSFLDNATPLLSTAIATASSLLNLGVDIPSATSTIAAVITTATAISNSSPHDKPKENGECELLGPFAILVQGSLGILALLSLVYKRWRERPQRPIKIWSFDVSKQVVGSVLVHIANLLMSLLSSGQLNITVDAKSVTRRALGMEGLNALAMRAVDAEGKYKPNPCSFYLLNLAIDTTVGIPILIVLLRILTALFSLTPVGNPPESIVSGNYGSPPRAFWWFKQSIIYFIGLMGMKVCVLIIFLLAPWISRVGDWALRWTEGDEVLQVVFVMLVFPVIMNATQYYIIDSFIKNQKPAEHEQIPSDDPDDSFDAARDAIAYGDPLSGSSDEINSEDEADPEVLAKANESKKQNERLKQRPCSSSSGSGNRTARLQTGSKDYDPLYDGESSPTVVGSASTSERLKVDEADDEAPPRK